MSTNINLNGIEELDVTVTGGTSSATVSDGVVALTLTPSAGSSIDLQTNGVDNTDQAKLNLKAGTNMTLTADGVGGVTFDASGGGSSSAIQPFSFPASPSAYDDEFEGSVLNAAWTTTLNTGVTTTYNQPFAQGCIASLVSGGGDHGMVFNKTVSMTSDYSVTMRVFPFDAQKSNFNSIGFYLADGSYSNPDTPASGNTIELFAGFSGSPCLQVQKWVPTQTVFTVSGLPAGPWSEVWLHWQRVSGTYRMFWSFNGGSWSEYTGFSSMPSFNPVRLGIIIRNYNSSGVTFRSAIDFIRCNWIFL